jgi:hypothetical protein
MQSIFSYLFRAEARSFGAANSSNLCENWPHPTSLYGSTTYTSLTACRAPVHVLGVRDNVSGVVDDFFESKLGPKGRYQSSQRALWSRAGGYECVMCLLTLLLWLWSGSGSGAWRPFCCLCWRRRLAARCTLIGQRLRHLAFYPPSPSSCFEDQLGWESWKLFVFVGCSIFTYNL